MDFRGMSDKAVQRELAGRLQRERLNRNLSQAELAGRAGISLRTVQYLEAGNEIILQTLIRVMRALDMLGQLDTFIPVPPLSPLQLARLKGQERQRASGCRGRKKAKDA